MRGLGLPARVVTGYQGGEYNPVDGFLVVRQSDAHAWAEVWLAGSGWLRVDPTAAVAPGRTGAMQRLVAPRGAFASALLGSVSPALAQQLRATWEALNNGWNQWVLNYTQGKQFSLLLEIGFSSPSWEDLSYLLIGIVVLASLTGAAWTLWERSRQDPWLALLTKATRHLEQAGLTIAPNSPPRRLAEQLQGHGKPDDPARLALQSWLLRLEAQRYARAGQQGAALATLRSELQQLIRRQ